VVRLAIGLLGVAALWVLAVTAALAILNLPATRARLAGFVAGRVAIALNQPVRIGDIRLVAVPPRLVLRGLSIGPVASPFVQIDVIEADFSDVRVASREIGVDVLRVHGVRVAGAPPAAGSPGGGSWVRVHVRQLQVDDVAIDNLEIPGGLVFSAQDFELRWDSLAGGPVTAAILHLGQFVLQVPGIDPIEGSLLAWGRRVPSGWQLGRVRGRGRGWEIVADAKGAGFGGEAEGSTVADLAALESLLHVGAGLSGPVRLRWQASLGATTEPRLDATVTAPRVTVAGLTFEQIEGEVHLSREGLEGSLTHARFAGGVLEATYTLPAFAPPWRHRIAARGRGIELEGFLRQLGAGDAGLAGGCSVSAEVTWDGGRFKQGVGTAVADIQPLGGDVPVSGRVIVSHDAVGALQFSTRGTTLAGSAVRWGGRLTLGAWIPTWQVKGELPVSTIARLLRGWTGTDVLPAELSGSAAVDVTLTGPFRDLRVVGDAAVAPIAFGPVDADGLEGSFTVAQGLVTVHSGTILVGPGRLRGHGWLRYGSDHALQVELAGKGVPLARMVAWGGVHAPLAGAVEASGTLGGTLEEPTANADLRLSKVSVAGLPLGDGQGHVMLSHGIVTVSDLGVGSFAASATVDVRRQAAVVDARIAGLGLEAISPPLGRLLGGTLDCALHGAFPFDSPQGTLEVTSQHGAHGRVELDATGLHVELVRPGTWRVAAELRRARRAFEGKISFVVESWRQMAQALGAGDVPLEGHMAGEAELRLAPPGPPRLVGSVREFVLEVEGERAVLQEPAAFRIEGGAIDVSTCRFAGPSSALVLTGRRSADGVLSGEVTGDVPAALLGLVWRQARAGGRLQVRGEISGTDAAPRFDGTAKVIGGSLHLAGLPGPVTSIDGQLEFNPEAIRLAGVKFRFMGGEGVCDGRISLSPQVELDLSLQGRGVGWPLIPGLTPLLAGELRLVGALDNLALVGHASLQHTVYRRQLNLQKLVVEQLLAPERTRSAEGSPLVLNITVDVPGTLEVDTPLASLSARGELRIVGTSQRYGVLGRLEALPGGEMEMAGLRYAIDRGTVTFTSPDQIEPRLDLLARTTVQNFDITVALNGKLDRLTPTLTANPPLPDMDIISLLSTGRVADQAGQAQAGAVASTFLVDQLTGAATNRARTLLDVDQLRVDPFAATQSGSPTARLTVVKQLSPGWTVTVSTNLAANREEVVNSRWRLGQGLYLEANREVDGTYSLEVKWQYRY
jgi:autotransporter translocation and assembly factor TamB